jgi:hypothetical protein
MIQPIRSDACYSMSWRSWPSFGRDADGTDPGIADGMSPVQISQIDGISTEQIPIFSLIWKEQINFAREEGIRENRPMELMFDVAELRAEIAKELAQGPSNDDDLDNDDPKQVTSGV